jgi:vancomycin aglycone glucosyltransferase
MRVLLSTYGSRGDVEPLVGLAVALEALGVEAVVSAPGDAEFVELTARAGVELAPAFMPVREWIDMPRKAPMDIPGYGRKMIGAQYEAIDAAAAGCDAVVATGLMPSVGAAQCVAEKRGLVYEHVTFCPLFLPSEHHKPFPYPGHPHPPGVTDPKVLWAINTEAMNALFGGTINGQRTAVGLPAVTNVRDHVFTAEPLLASDRVLWPWEPTALCDAVQTGAWILPDARPLPAELEAFLDAGEPPVYLGFGSIAVPHAKATAEAAIGAIRKRGLRVVLARGGAEMAAIDNGEDCFVIGEINQQALFPRMAVVVHHGGAGTTSTASRSGSPQLIVPQIVDQPFWAARVAGLGIGVAHDGPAPTFDSFEAALTKALSPAIAARAKAVGPTIRTDGAMVAAKRLVEMI